MVIAKVAAVVTVVAVSLPISFKLLPFSVTALVLATVISIPQLQLIVNFVDSAIDQHFNLVPSSTHLFSQCSDFDC